MLIPMSLQLVGVHLGNFKLKWFYLTGIILKYLRSTTLGWKDIGIRKSINSFLIVNLSLELYLALSCMLSSTLYYMWCNELDHGVHKFHEKGIIHLEYCTGLSSIVCNCTVQLSLTGWKSAWCCKWIGIYSGC